MWFVVTTLFIVTIVALVNDYIENRRDNNDKN